MEGITFNQQQKQLELDRRAWELDRQAFQLESEKKSFQLEIQQQKSQFEQQVQSLNQREQSLNTRFNHIEQTLLDISSTPLLLQQPQQHQAEQHQAEKHQAEKHQAEQEHEEQHNEQQQVLSSPSSLSLSSPSLSSLSSLSSHDNNQQSITTVVPNFDMMINIYDQHLTTLAKTLKTTARKLAKKEMELNEKIEQYNLFPPEVVKPKSSQDVVQQATQCITCEKCDKISELDQREDALEKAEVRMSERKATLDKGEADLRQREHKVLSQERTMSQSERGRMVECLTAIKQANKDCSIPFLDAASRKWKWTSNCNEFCWRMHFKRHEIKDYSIQVTFVRDDDRSYRCQYEFGLYGRSCQGTLNSFINYTLQKQYTNPIKKISFSTPLIDNGEWFTTEEMDFYFPIFFVSPQYVKIAIHLDSKTLNTIDATEHEILFKVE